LGANGKEQSSSALPFSGVSVDTLTVKCVRVEGGEWWAFEGLCEC